MGNDPLFLNKVAGAILSAGLLAMMVGFISGKIYHPKPLEKAAFAIGGDGAAPAATQAAAAPAGPQPIGPMLANASVDNGLKVAKKCVSCHTFEKGGKNKIGPNLWDVVGKEKAATDGFRYSSKLRGMEGSWGFEELSQFLYSPRGYARGTSMSFAGIKKDADRANLIAYLRSLSDNPNSLP